MKTAFDLMDYVYNIINVSAVTTLLDGNIYKGKKPVGLQTKDITIGVLTNQWDEVIQRGIVNINCYALKLSGGVHDSTNLKAIADAVNTAIGNYSQTGDTYFDLYPDVPGIVYDDIEDPLMSYINIRIRNFIET